MAEEIVLPAWDSTEFADFLIRTPQKYARTLLHQMLDDRGLANERLNQLVAALPMGAYVSGGFMNAVLKGASDEASDLDIFFSSSEAFLKTYDLLTKPKTDKDAEEPQSVSFLKGYVTEIKRETLFTDKTLRFVKFTNPDKPKWPPIQLVKLVWYDNAEHLIDSFDLTVVQFATDGNELVYNPLGIMDLVRKRIVLHRMQFPASTLRRLVKYASKGFYACPGSLARIANEITLSINKDPRELEKYVYID
jgi:hypothetical protein